MEVTSKLIILLSSVTVLFCLAPSVNAQSQTRVLTQEDFDHIPQGLVTGGNTGTRIYSDTDNRFNHEDQNMNHSEDRDELYEDHHYNSNHYDPFREAYWHNGVPYNANGDRIERGYQ